MFVNLGICKGSGDNLCWIYTDLYCLEISRIGRSYFVSLNKRNIIAARSKEELIKITPVISHVIQNIMKSAQLDTARWGLKDKRYTDLVLETIKNIKKNLQKVEVYVLEAKPDETQDNRSILSDSQDLKLSEFSTGIKRFCETKNAVIKILEVLFKTELDKKMWGSTEVKKVINTVKLNVNDLSESYETVDGCVERLDRRIDILKLIFSKKNGYAQLRNIIGIIMEDFAHLKSFLSRMVVILNPFYYINDTFKSYTKFPATWFLDGSWLMDFMFEYNNLIDYLIKFALWESTIIEPLLALRIKLNGELNHV